MLLVFNLTLNGLHKFISNPRQQTFMRLALLYGGKKRYKKGKDKFDGFNQKHSLKLASGLFIVSENQIS